MEKNSTISKRWKISMYASFIGFFIFMSYLNNRREIILFNPLTTTTTMTFTTKPLNPAITPFTELSNFTRVLKPATMPFAEVKPATIPSAEPSNSSQEAAPIKQEEEEDCNTNLTEKEKPIIHQEEKKCNIFEGKWVFNPQGNPPYHAHQCQFLEEKVRCQMNGRPDFSYENWSWEAKDDQCHIPRFNGTDMLERLRGKRVIIVGDSLNRNQWFSLACLLYSAIPHSRAIIDVKRGEYKFFKAKDYDCTVEFYWSPFVVKLDDTKKKGKVVRLEKLPDSAKHWRGADIMVFNTGHWWTHQGKFKVWDFCEYNGKLVEEIETETALDTAMKTWARWIDRNVDTTKTTVFFRSISPEHKGEQWCYNQTQPIMDESYVPIFPKPIRDVVEKTIESMKTPVRYLNITKLSEYRMDAHPSIYALKDGMRPKDRADCSHWCLPGLPDTWNRLMYADMVLNSPNYISSSSQQFV